MASSRLSTVHKLQKPVVGDSNDSKDGSHNNSGNNSGTRKKTKPEGKIVKSRYQQAVNVKSAVKTPAKDSPGSLKSASSRSAGGQNRSSTTHPKQSLSGQSVLNPPSLSSSTLEPSILGGNLQSTVLDGHCVRPEFDLSVIEERMASENMDMESAKELLEHQTFLMAYLTAKMESNTQKLKEEAERNLLAMMEEEEKLRQRVHKKKQQHLLLEKRKQRGELLDLQNTALAPVSAAAQQFTQDYQTFATALDTTRHELPVKSFHIQGDKRDFLEKVETCLQESEAVLRGCESGARPESERALDLLRAMKEHTQQLGQELSREFSDVLELSSLVSQQACLTQSSLEEAKMGMGRTRALYMNE
ncbi:hypothetical protein AGOR_G00239010 [Albula goreensis]|uniref:HAUS augmin-like complex subunit 8 n=1 Tax=Albula goreensis TaxID=1534307 RepID=A0A8T3CDH8_9TELE|nr:hypothetical protein AGOR_G00239010 [Albula goreensis]